MPETDKSTRFEVVSAMLRAAAGLYDGLAPHPSEVKDEFLSFRAGNFTEGQKILDLAVEHKYWDNNTFRLDLTSLRQPIGRVTLQNSFEAYLGQPMKQSVPYTCVLVACTVCVEALHRLEHAKNSHGEGTFPYRAVVPDKNSTLFIECSRDRIWEWLKGADVGAVLNKIRQLGGVLATTNAPIPATCHLPLRDWQRHVGAGLTPERVAELLDCHGFCVGVLWMCPWYHRFDAGRDDALVYRGCGRSEHDMRRSQALYGANVGFHAVVCFAYRILHDEQMHVLVLDNHGPTGPRRWVDVEELVALFTLIIPECGEPGRSSAT